ncbi:hypothetical protein [Saccharothrix xinjiangensis]|uniref:Uncharacterized protein n=1 Tax=Saccharothrix xinjiangensis TaxID=204798 RepID=A0ABV9XTE7_9PSEU
MTTHRGRTLTLFWTDHQVVGRWCDGTELPPAPTTAPADRVAWLVDLIAEHRRTYPGARVRATNRPTWRPPHPPHPLALTPPPRSSPPQIHPQVIRSPLPPLHHHVTTTGHLKECWHHCPD